MRFDDDGQRQGADRAGYTGLTSLTIRQLAAVVMVVCVVAAAAVVDYGHESGRSPVSEPRAGMVYLQTRVAV